MTIQKKTTKETEEINKIKRRIMKRYQIFDKYFANQCAVAIYQNGITIETFNNLENYNKKGYDIDELISYIILKESIKVQKQKRINFDRLEEKWKEKQKKKIIKKI